MRKLSSEFLELVAPPRPKDCPFEMGAPLTVPPELISNISFCGAVSNSELLAIAKQFRLIHGVALQSVP
jgi:hypothetical protein